jgi:hypothetical protein
MEAATGSRLVSHSSLITCEDGMKRMPKDGWDLRSAITRDPSLVEVFGGVHTGPLDTLPPGVQIRVKGNLIPKPTDKAKTWWSIRVINVDGKVEGRTDDL